MSGRNVSVYSILDTLAKAFTMPFFAPNHSVAFRVVEKSMKNPQSGFADSPADFTLFKLGEFDADTGVLLPAFPAPENLGSLVQFVPPPVPSMPSVPDRMAG